MVVPWLEHRAPDRLCPGSISVRGNFKSIRLEIPPISNTKPQIIPRWYLKRGRRVSPFVQSIRRSIATDAHLRTQTVAIVLSSCFLFHVNSCRRTMAASIICTPEFPASRYNSYQRRDTAGPVSPPRNRNNYRDKDLITIISEIAIA